EGRAHRGVKLPLHLVGDEPCEGGLAEAGKPAEEHVVERLLALARRFDADLEVRHGLPLADELVERAGAEGVLEFRIALVRAGPGHGGIIAGRRFRIADFGLRIRDRWPSVAPSPMTEGSPERDFRWGRERMTSCLNPKLLGRS